jgi:acyl-CoA synthetase (AMP-forming)/AMP-acid ligase II
LPPCGGSRTVLDVVQEVNVLAPRLSAVSDYLDHWAASTPDALAGVQGSQRLTYAELRAAVLVRSRGLRAAGVRPGDRVAVVADPSIDFWVTFLATVHAGGVYVGVNPKYTVPEREYVLGDARPTVVVDLVGLGQIPSACTAEQLDMAAGAGGDTPIVPVHPRSPAAVVYTSGSTGRPKGALLPHDGLVRCSVVQARRWVSGPGVALLCNLPVNHVGCIGDICTSTLVAGGTLVFQPKFNPAEVLDLIARHRIGMWGAVPAMFLMSVRTPEWETADLSSLERIISSGGAIPLDLVAALRTKCATVSTSYGSTETVGSILYSDDGADDATLAATIGRPDDEYEVAILDAAGSPVPAGATGELCVRGDHIMLGYLDRPEDTAEAIDAQGWLRTGDTAMVRPDGQYVLIGRVKEMFKSGGYNVYPREVELALEEHPRVSLACVLGVPDDVYGQVGRAFLAADGDIAPDELKAFLSTRLANYKIPKSFVVRDALPMLPIGKVDKQALRTPAATATATATATAQ